jgi:hypothetical protein
MVIEEGARPASPQAKVNPGGSEAMVPLQFGMWGRRSDSAARGEQGKDLARASMWTTRKVENCRHRYPSRHSRALSHGRGSGLQPGRRGLPLLTWRISSNGKHAPANRSARSLASCSCAAQTGIPSTRDALLTKIHTRSAGRPEREHREARRESCRHRRSQ